MIPIQFFKSIEMFEGLTDYELAAARRISEEVELSEDSVLFREKDPADYLFTVIDGTIVLTYELPGQGEQKLKELGAGETFGWSAVVPPYRYTLTARCEGPCRVLRVPARALLELFEGDPTIGYKVMRNLARLAGHRFLALQEKLITEQGHDVFREW